MAKVTLPSFLTGPAPYIKTPKIEGAERALRLNKYDTEAWEMLFNGLSPQPIERVRVVYDDFLKLMPTATKYYRAYVAREMQAQNYDRVEQLLGGALLEIPHSHLWQAYIDYVRATKGKEEIERAYEFALDTVGPDINSTILWLGYFDFMKQLKNNTAEEWTDSRLLNTRKRFKEVLEYQVHRLEEFWKMFEAFETENLERLYPNARNPGDDKQASDKHLKDMSAKYKRSLVAYKEKQVLRQHLVDDMLPVHSGQSSSFGDQLGAPIVIPNLTQSTLPKKLKEQLQLPLWLQIIQYEKSNIQRLDKDQLHKRVKLLYNQAITCLYYNPEIWHSTALWLSSKGSVDEAIQTFEKGCKALPGNLMLNLAFADFLFSKGEVDKACTVYQNFIEHTIADGKDNTLALVHYLRFLHKAKGSREARAMFMKNKDNAGWQLFSALAQMEWRLNREPVVARNIFESGMAKHSQNLKFVMAYMEFLECQNDDRNLGLLFEKCIASENNPEVWARYLDHTYHYSDADGIKSVEAKMATRFPKHASKGFYNLTQRLKYLDLWPVNDMEYTAFAREQSLKTALAKHTSTRVDSTTFQMLYGDTDMEMGTSDLANRLGPNDIIPNHTNPILDVVRRNVNQIDFGGLKPCTLPLNPTPPEPSQDQLLDIPVVPANWGAHRATAAAAVVKKEDMRGAPIGLSGMRPAVDDMKPEVKIEDVPKPPIGAPSSVGGPIPAKADATRELPSMLAKLLNVLPPAHAYKGPLADVEYVLDMITSNPLPPPPDDAAKKRPLDQEEDLEGPPSKKPAVDIYAERRAMKSKDSDF